MPDALSQTMVNYFLPFSLAMITLAMGLGLTMNDFKVLWQKPKAAIIGMIGQLLVLPLLAFSVAFTLKLAPAFAVGLVLLAACPGGAHSNLLTSLAKGDVALSIALTAINGLLCIVSIPVYVYLATIAFTDSSTVITLPVGDTVLQLLLIVLLPLALGLELNHMAPKFAAIAETIVKGLAVCLLILIIVGAVANSWAKVVLYAQDVGLAIIVLNLLAMSFGAILANIGRLPTRQRITISMEVGVQNTTLAFGLALTVLNSLMISVPAIIYALWVYVAASIVIIISRCVIKPMSTMDPNT